MKKILIVDDEIDMLRGLKKLLSHREDISVTTESDPQKALALTESEKFDIILTDLRMNQISGIDILRSALGAFPDSTVIIISGYGTIDASVEAMREGAFDFLEKPFSSQKLFDCIDRALRRRSISETVDGESEPDSKLSEIVYQSAAMGEVLNLVRKIAPGNMNVLITGESGTGKELIARAIHQLSDRLHQSFIPVNCGALPENLFESELFGHEKGAFTGATKTKPGLLEFANHGTFFFDEIGDMGLNLQVKLLRMLEDHKIRHVGGKQEIDVDVRIIAATNHDLEMLIREHQFREDLYYRLNTIQIQIPPIRERGEDILPLAYHFLNQLNATHDKHISGFSSEAINALQSYSWPGNVREMQNIIHRAYIMSSTHIIQRPDLPLQKETNSINLDDTLLTMNYKEAKEKVIEKFELEYLTHYLRKNQGNISKTAAECGLDRRSIHRLINRYNIVYES